MQNFVNQIKYGNQNIGDKEDLDRFWLERKLRITLALESILLRLVATQLTLYPINKATGKFCKILPTAVSPTIV